MKTHKLITLASVAVLTMQMPMQVLASETIEQTKEPKVTDLDNLLPNLGTMVPTVTTTQETEVSSEEAVTTQETADDTAVSEETEITEETVTKESVGTESSSEQQNADAIDATADSTQESTEKKTKAADDQEIVDIPDYALKLAIIGTLKLTLVETVAKTPVTKADLLRLTTLQIDGSSLVNSLEGLQYATNLTSFNLTKFSDTVDFSLLGSLTNLISLTIIPAGLSTGVVKDLSFVKNLTKLISLNIPRNAITDISPLANTPLLTSLILSSNKIDAATVNVLGTLTNLNELKLDFTDVKDYSWLPNLQKLQTLNISNNNLVDGDILEILQLPDLSTLYVQHNKLTDLNTFKNMKHCLLLQAEYNRIEDLTPLLSYNNVEQVNLRANLITDITPLSVMKAENAKYVQVMDNFISDFSPLVNIRENDMLINGAGQKIDLGVVYIRDGEVLKVTNPAIGIDSLPMVPDKFTPNFGVYDASDNTFVWENITSKDTNGYPTVEFKRIYDDKDFSNSEKKLSGVITMQVVFVECLVNVLYVDEAGNEIAPADVLNGKKDTDYEAIAKDIEGWELKETPTNAKGTYTNDDQTVTFVYKQKEAAPITVEYVDEAGNALAPAKTMNGKIGDTYKTDAETITGWTVKTTPTNAQGTFTDQAQTVTYVYEKAEGAAVTVKYVDESGNELAPSETLTGKIGTPYDTAAKSITDWTVKTTPANAKGTFTDQEQTVTYIYEKANGAPVTVEYVDELGNELAPSETLNGKLDAPYTTTAKSLTGWTVKTTPANAQGTFTKQAQTVTYVYEIADGAPVTVEYVDELGNELAPSETMNGKLGVPYTTAAKSLAGWTIKTTPTNAQGTFTDQAQTVTYVYEKAEGAPVTVKYLDESGNELAPSEILSGKLGTPYDAKAKSLAGWVVKTTPLNAQGIFTDQAQTVTYVYEKAEGALITVQYLDEAGNELAPSETLSGKLDAPYATSAKSLAGWVVKTTPLNAQGTFTDQAQTVTYVYEKAEGALITVQYLDEAGNELAPSETLSGKLDAPYATSAKSLSGWAVKATPLNAQGVFTDQVQTVTYMYEKAEGALITVQYLDEAGNELAPPETLSGKLDAPYATTAKSLAGWVVKTTPLNAQGTFTDQAQTVTYVYEKADGATVTVEYVDEAGNELVPSEIISGKLDASYETTAKSLAGWAVKVVPVNAQGTFTDQAQTVTYVYEKADGAAVIIRYVDESDNELAEPTNLSGKIAETFTIDAKELTNYTLITGAKISGEFKGDPQEFKFVYKANSKTIKDDPTSKNNASNTGQGSNGTASGDSSYSNRSYPNTGETNHQATIWSGAGLLGLGAMILAFRKRFAKK